MICECGNHVFAQTSRWGVVLLSREDASLIADYVWTLTEPRKGKFYARSEKLARETGTAGYMHSAIIPDAEMVDHRSGDGLDNRRENVRRATKSQNAANSGKPSGRSSQFKGVFRNSGRGRQWKASVKIAGKDKHLGYFDKEEDAAAAYDKAAREVFGEFAQTNF